MPPGDWLAEPRPLTREKAWLREGLDCTAKNFVRVLADYIGGREWRLSAPSAFGLLSGVLRCSVTCVSGRTLFLQNGVQKGRGYKGNNSLAS